MFRKRGLEFNRFFTKGKALSLGSKDLVTCSPSSTVGSVLQNMLEGHRKIPVTKGKQFVGLLTVNDVLDYCGAGERFAHFNKKNPLQVRVGKIMETRVVRIPASTSKEKALSFFKEYRRGSFPLVNGEELTGILADWDFLTRIQGNIGIPVEELMVHKPAQVRESWSVLDAAKIMVRGGYRRLPVTKSTILVGIILPSDILGYLYGEGNYNLHQAKKNLTGVMRADVHTVSREDDIGVAVGRMLKHKVGGLPVVEDQELVGMITESDIVHGLV